jgi:hypothetical protein
MNKEQLEMGLGTNAKARWQRRGQQRQKRAQWWFQQMRLLVNSAIDWKPAPPARPEQTFLILSRTK